LKPLLSRLVNKSYDGISLKGDYFERAIYRGTLKAWLRDGAERTGGG
jgi:hypothetical protein